MKKISLMKAFVAFWFFWFCWMQTVGRIPGALSLGPTLLFDVLISMVIYYIFKKEKATNEGFFEISSADSRSFFFIKFVLALLLSSIVFNAVFQIPLDWDGMDYHLPPVIEAFQKHVYERTANPYFAARNYPKVASSLGLWWLIHIGSLTGLRTLLIPQLSYLFMGLIASFTLIRKNFWVMAAFLSLPLVAHESYSFYADLPGLTILLLALVFYKTKNHMFAIVALSLFAALKFTNIQIAFVLIFVMFLVERSFKRAILYFIPVLIFTLIQPLENLKYEGRPFGPLKCEIMGKDYCNGTIDPKTLIVAPIVPDYKKEDPYLKKVLTGHTPSQVIPGSDVNTGGFGWASIFSFFVAVFLGFSSRTKVDLKRRMKDYWPLVILPVVDLTIPGLWYARYHMPLAWALSMFMALLMMNQKVPRPFKTLIATLMVLQILWLVPNRNFFLGVKSGEAGKLIENVVSMVRRGYPKYATNPADVRREKYLSINGKNIDICGEELRPSLMAFGVELKNTVRWFSEKQCPHDSGFIDEFEKTKVFVF